MPPLTLACPACGWLVHGERLRELAADAESAEGGGDHVAARDRWLAALELLPAQSQQHAAIRDRAGALTRAIDRDAGASPSPGAGGAAWWRRGLPGFGVLVILLVSKLKFLLLGLTKASTFVSMFAFFGLYWSIYGWPLALGLALSIYVHEMGHVAMLRRFRLDAGAPVFIPGVGAFVLLKQPVLEPLTDAKIGLAGPVWGLGAGLAALAVYGATGAPIWFAIAQVTGFLNLFNLIPVWQLDGSRGIPRPFASGAVGAGRRHRHRDVPHRTAAALHRRRRRRVAGDAGAGRTWRPPRARDLRRAGSAPRAPRSRRGLTAAAALPFRGASDGQYEGRPS